MPTEVPTLPGSGGSRRGPLPWGDHRPHTVEGTVWFDADADGEQDDGEPGLAGFDVELLPAAGFGAQRLALSDRARRLPTDHAGHVVFEDVAAGDYVLRAQRPAFLAVTYDSQGASDARADLTVPVGGHGVAWVGLVGTRPGGAAAPPAPQPPRSPQAPAVGPGLAPVQERHGDHEATAVRPRPAPAGLPATGRDTSALALAAAAMLVSGGALVALSRSRRPWPGRRRGLHSTSARRTLPA